VRAVINTIFWLMVGSLLVALGLCAWMAWEHDVANAVVCMLGAATFALNAYIIRSAR
jgi:hypothetical protein